MLTQVSQDHDGSGRLRDAADVKRLTSILSDLAIQPLWYDSLADIPRFLAGIAA